MSGVGGGAVGGSMFSLPLHLQTTKGLDGNPASMQVSTLDPKQSHFVWHLLRDIGEQGLKP